MADKGKKRKRSALYAPVAFILIIAALVFGMSVFFRVSDITVTGNSIYTAEEIIEASGVSIGDNLFFLNRLSAMSRINSRLPYIESAEISRALPSSVTIVVTESSALAYLANEDGLWAVDKNCKVLSNVAKENFGSLIQVTGINPISPTVGETVAAGEAEGSKVKYLKEILGMIAALELQGDITDIDMSNVSSPHFRYLGRFTVKLGAHENVDYKFQLMISAVQKLQSGDSGILDLSIDNRAHLTYD